MDLDFSEDEIQRYSRQILLTEVGGTGQAALRAARVLVVGAGGIGSPLLLYLAAAGVGTLGIVDADRVELSNLQRQIAHRLDSVGRAKVRSAAEGVGALNPLVHVVEHEVRLDVGNAAALIEGYNIVADGSDNATTRYVLADACHVAGKTLVSAAAVRFEGQLAVFAPGTPCYRCVYPEAAVGDAAPSCAEAGILGSVVGVVGALAATEVMKQVLHIGETLAGRLLLWDALAARFHVVALRHDPACVLCGAGALMTDLNRHTG